MYNPAHVFHAYNYQKANVQYILNAVDSLEVEPLVMLVKFLPEISGMFKHPKHPLVTALLYSFLYCRAALARCWPDSAVINT